MDLIQTAVPRLRGMTLIALLAWGVDWGIKALHPILGGWWIPHAANRPVFAMLLFGGLGCATVCALLPNRWTLWGAGLAMGGMLGNLMDLARQGKTWDMIPMPWNTDHLFNLADLGLACGMLCLILSVLHNLYGALRTKNIKIQA